jgi:hypothetical protein
MTFYTLVLPGSLLDSVVSSSEAVRRHPWVGAALDTADLHSTHTGLLLLRHTELSLGHGLAPNDLAGAVSSLAVASRLLGHRLKHPV